MKNKQMVTYILIGSAFLFIVVLSFFNKEAGMLIGGAVIKNSLTMLKILPLTFILIALFEVWVEREKVERHLGEKGGMVSYLWVLILGGTTMGPMIVALPVAAALLKKGARLPVIFTYIGAASVCRIPMTIFESSYLGVKFTLIRYAVSIPLIIISSIVMGKILQKKGYRINQ